MNKELNDKILQSAGIFMDLLKDCAVSCDDEPEQLNLVISVFFELVRCMDEHNKIEDNTATKDSTPLKETPTFHSESDNPYKYCSIDYKALKEKLLEVKPFVCLGNYLPKLMHNELEELSKPLVELLREHYDPHCQVIISDGYVKVVRDEIGVPFEIDD